jgi:hypothetical protein
MSAQRSGAATGVLAAAHRPAVSVANRDVPQAGSGVMPLRPSRAYPIGSTLLKGVTQLLSKRGKPGHFVNFLGSPWRGI